MAAEEEDPIEMLLNNTEQSILKIYEDRKLEFSRIINEYRSKSTHLIKKIANVEQKLQKTKEMNKIITDCESALQRAVTFSSENIDLVEKFKQSFGWIPSQETTRWASTEMLTLIEESKDDVLHPLGCRNIRNKERKDVDRTKHIRYC